METVGEQGALAEHALIPSGEFDFGDGECVAEVETSIHVRVWVVAEPFRKAFVEFFLGEVSDGLL